MDLNKMFLEEDNFPKKITSYEERDWGILFYDKNNRLSRDSNHALIYEQKVQDIDQVLQEIVQFYQEKDIFPSIYQAIDDEGYFMRISEKLEELGFEVVVESRDFMALTDENTLDPNEQIVVKRVTEWNDDFTTEIFHKSDKLLEMSITKKALQNPNTLFFVAYLDDVPVGLLRSHITNDVCRVNNLQVSKDYPNIGVDSTLIYHFVEYCHQNNMENCYLWPDDEFTKQIYHQAGFRVVETKRVSYAIYIGEGYSVEDRLKFGMGDFKYAMYKNPGKTILYSGIVATVLLIITLLFKTAGGGLALFFYPLSWLCYVLDRLSINTNLRKYRKYKAEANFEKIHRIPWPNSDLAKAFSGFHTGRDYGPFSFTIALWIMSIIAAPFPPS